MKAEDTLALQDLTPTVGKAACLPPWRLCNLSIKLESELESIRVCSSHSEANRPERQPNGVQLPDACTVIRAGSLCFSVPCQESKSGCEEHDAGRSLYIASLRTSWRSENA